MKKTHIFSVIILLILQLILIPKSSYAIYEETTEFKPIFVPNEIIVKYKPGLAPLELKTQAESLSTLNTNRASALESYNQAKQLNQSLGIVNTDTPSEVIEGVVLYETNGQVGVEDVVNRLYLDDSVEYAEPNYYYYTLATPNDQLFSQQWDMKKINLPAAWDKTKGSSSIKVAVIDTGVKNSHPDFTGKIVDQQGFGLCPPGNDIKGHGTHVAGTIGANTNNTTGVAGVNWDVGIMDLRASCDSRGSFDLNSITRAIDYAINNGAKVINMSLGGPRGSRSMADIITQAVSKGVTVVAASGNAGPGTADNHFPSSYPNVISVGSTTINDQISSFSSTGSSVDVSAPGSNILSTWNNGSYNSISGTSMASPHVAGVVALMYALNPSIRPSEVKSILESTAVDLGPPGRDNAFGAGRIDALATLNKVSGTGGTPLTPIVGIPTPTSAPNVTNSPQPTGTGGCTLLGDYDCSGTVDKADYVKLVADLIAGTAPLRKFEEWRRVMYAGQ